MVASPVNTSDPTRSREEEISGPAREVIFREIYEHVEKESEAAGALRPGYDIYENFPISRQ